MLWNWYTVDSCFISSTWHITSKGMFAGSCIGVILLVIALEGLRRGQRELDRYLHRINAVNAGGSDAGSSQGLKGAAGGADRLRLWQHLLRSLLFMVQFAVGYFVMLLAMYYNGWSAYAFTTLGPSFVDALRPTRLLHHMHHHWRIPRRRHIPMGYVRNWEWAGN